MSIIISKDGQNAKRLERAVIHQEDYLQQYIDKNGDCIPLHDLKENFRLQILAREFATPRGGCIDLLGVDADGEIYIIETKLAKNADKRRIIAQALDYGAAIWGNPAELLARAEELEWRSRMLEFLGNDENALVSLLAAVERNAKAGRFWFVILMDHLDDGLRELISFVNRSSQFKVLGVELDFYTHEGFEIVIPKLYGGESANDPNSPTPEGAQRKRRWEESSFFAEAEERFGADFSSRLKEIHDRSKAIGGVISGTGKTFFVTFTVAAKPVFSVSGDRHLEIQFEPLDKENPTYSSKLRALLEGSGFLKPSDPKKYPRISISGLPSRVSEFMQLLQKSLDA
jgi:hypothetical protein